MVGSDQCWDVITLGEAMIRLTPPGAQRLEQSSEFRVFVGGSEANVAVGLSRLGMRSAWIGRLPRNPLGMRVVGEIAKHGVDASHVIWAEAESRVGLYYVEVAGNPRGCQVVYDRRGSAASDMQPEHVDWNLLSQARHVHLTGITPALSQGCADMVHRALQEAKMRGLSISFDVNYRSRLWDYATAQRVLEPFLGVDVVFCTLEDARHVFQCDGAPEQVAQTLRQDWGAGTVVLTLGGEGAIAVGPDRTWSGQVYHVDPVDRLGAGDAYVAGFLCGYLEGSIERAMSFAGAMAAWKYSEPGDFCYARRTDIERLVSCGDREIRR